MSADPVAPVDVEGRRARRDGSGVATRVDSARTDAGRASGGAEKVGMPLSAEADGRLERAKGVTVSAKGHKPWDRGTDLVCEHVGHWGTTAGLVCFPC